MRLPETRDLFAQKLEFPATRETVIESVGETELHAPAGEHETIAEIVERSDTDSFDSADGLYNTLMSFAGEGFIGRKYYDDRGGSSVALSEDGEVRL
jgi:hypothetical protein